MSLTLASRPAIAATDGAQVNGSTINLGRVPTLAVATFFATVTGAPTTWDMRAAIEASPDGGTTWFQVLRFKDITNAQLLLQTARFGSQGAASEVDIALSTLGNAAAAAVLSVDTPWPTNLRAVTKLQTLTGGASPTVVATVLLEIT